MIKIRIMNSKEEKDNKEVNNSKEGKDNKEEKDNKEVKEGNNSKEGKDNKGEKDYKEVNNSKEGKYNKGEKDYKEKNTRNKRNEVLQRIWGIKEKKDRRIVKLVGSRLSVYDGRVLNTP